MGMTCVLSPSAPYSTGNLIKTLD